MLKLKRLLRREGQFDPDILCYCFDRAVLYFGHWVDATLMETDNEGHPLHTLSELLDREAHEPVSAEDAALLLRMQMNTLVGKPVLDGMKRR